MVLKYACLVIVSLFLQIWISQAATGPTHGKVVVCYLGSWAVYRPERGSFSIEDLDPSVCTHLIYSFAGLNIKEDSPKSLDPWQDLTDDYGKGGYKKITALKSKYPHLKVSLAIGGWNEGSANYSKLAASPVRRGTFVENALNYVRKYNFDGLDLDWEFPGARGGSLDDKQNFLLLVKELKAAFRKHNLLLTAAFSAGKDTIDRGYDIEGLSVYLDFIHMMCYDFHGAWDKRTGANAPLRGPDSSTVEYSINYIIGLGASAKKIVLGVPLYGRTFIMEEPLFVSPHRKPRLGSAASTTGFAGPFTKEPGFMGYNEICLEIRNTSLHWKTYWDEESRTPFAVSNERLIAYDNEQSIAEKVHFAMEKGLAGIMVWSIDTDDFRGDCADADDETQTTFPLMRSINKSIEKSLKDLENVIIDNKDTKGSASVLSGNTLVIILVCIFEYMI